MQPFNASGVVNIWSSAVLYVEVLCPSTVGKNGEQIPERIDIGSAFHLGDGFFATARHVVEGNKILRIGREARQTTTVHGNGRTVRTSTHAKFSTDIIENIYHHPSDKVDVSVIQISNKDIQPSVRLYPSADTKTESEYLMEDVVTVGYPPIPFATDAHLVVFRGEVSAVIQNYSDQKRHFVISGMARGGFSGGPVFLVENGMVLGIVCTSLGKPDQTEELGFIGAVSAETIFELVAHHGLNIRLIEQAERQRRTFPMRG